MSCGSSDCITSTKRGLAEIAIAFSVFHAQGCGTIGGAARRRQGTETHQNFEPETEQFYRNISSAFDR
jgi:hypothetical protein